MIVANDAASLGTPSVDGVLGRVHISTNKFVVLAWNQSEGVWVSKPEKSAHLIDQMPMSPTSSGYLQGIAADDNLAGGGVPMLNPHGVGFPLYQIENATEWYGAGLRLQERLFGEMQWLGPGFGDPRIYVNWYELDIGGTFLAPVPTNPGVILTGYRVDGVKIARSSGWTLSPIVPPTHPIWYPELYGDNLARIRGFVAERRWVAGAFDHGIPGDGSAKAPPWMVGYQPSHWFCADNVPAADNAPVSEWPDFSGYHRSAIQTNATRKPILKKNQINGHAAVAFDGVNDYMATDGPTGGNFQRTTSFLVVKQYGGGPSQEIWVDGVTQNYFMYKQDNEVHVWSGQPGGDVIYDRGTGAWPSPYLIISQQASDTAGTKLYENGVLKTNVARNSGGGPGGITLGARRSAFDLPAHCDIAEFLCYAQVLTDTDHDAIVLYLKSKYGIV